MRRDELSDGARATLAALEEADGAPFEQMTAPEARAAFDSSWADLQSSVPPTVAESLGPLRFIGEAGDIPALAWRGRRAPGSGARVLLYLHGGGWVVGSPASHASICRRLAEAGDAVVVCPDYRLAPEHPFPAGLEDALSCLRQLALRPEELGGSPDRLAVAGDSAGGNLAAVLALCAARDMELPCPVAQLLFYPNTSAQQSHGSYARFGDGYGLTARTMRWFRDCYVGKPADLHDWRVSPLLADLNHGSRPLAPAFVALAGADILHDEGLEYAERLSACGVRTKTRTWVGHLHGFLSACRYDPAAHEAVAAAAEFWRAVDP